MSRSFHVTRKNFKNCSNKDLEEMVNDEYSEFSEWAYKKHVKKTEIEKRKFKKVFIQIINDENLSDDQISQLDDREYFYKVLHNRIYSKIND